MLKFYERANCWQSERGFESHTLAVAFASIEQDERGIPCEVAKDSDGLYHVITYLHPDSRLSEPSANE